MNPSEVLSAFQGNAPQTKEPVIDVWPESIGTLNLWARWGHMWNYGPMGGRICLRWESIHPRILLAERSGEEIPAVDIDGLEVLESVLVRNQPPRKKAKR